MMLQLTLIQKIIVYAIPVLFAVTVHEVAHGWVASKFGDKTAQILGRLTLNPFKHIDLIGTVLVPLLTLWAGGFIFGWAKPVPINPRNFKNKRAMIWVALAGPGANLVMSVIWVVIAIVAKALMGVAPNIFYFVVLMARAGIIINLILLAFNIIPIPPLDGSRVVSYFLRGRMAYYYDRLEPYGFYIILLMIFTGMLGFIFRPINILISFLFQLIGLI